MIEGVGLTGRPLISEFERIRHSGHCIQYCIHMHPTVWRQALLGCLRVRMPLRRG
jgi:hypothetical protein